MANYTHEKNGAHPSGGAKTDPSWKPLKVVLHMFRAPKETDFTRSAVVLGALKWCKNDALRAQTHSHTKSICSSTWKRLFSFCSPPNITTMHIKPGRFFTTFIQFNSCTTMSDMWDVTIFISISTTYSQSVFFVFAERLVHSIRAMCSNMFSLLDRHKRLGENTTAHTYFGDKKKFAKKGK